MMHIFLFQEQIEMKLLKFYVFQSSFYFRLFSDLKFLLLQKPEDAVGEDSFGKAKVLENALARENVEYETDESELLKLTKSKMH